MVSIEVLKFGSSVLRSPGDLHVAVDEVYRRWRAGCQVLAVVSAFDGVTDGLLADVTEALGTACPEATATYLATGEIKTAALLHGSLRQYGLPSRIADPREIDLRAEGSPLESAPIHVDRAALDRLWQHTPILVLPGFYGIDPEGRIALFGRGGSDLSALFLAAALRAGCRLLKDVPGVFDMDPARSMTAHRFTSISWERAVQVAGPLIQPKALDYARTHDLSFEVGRPNEATGTLVGHMHDEWETSSSSPPRNSPATPPRPLRVALYGCGIVGRGVYEALRRYPRRFEIRHVIVRNIERYPDIYPVTDDCARGFEDAVERHRRLLRRHQRSTRAHHGRLTRRKTRRHREQGGRRLPRRVAPAPHPKPRPTTLVRCRCRRRPPRFGNPRAPEHPRSRNPRHRQRHLRRCLGRLVRRPHERGSHRPRPIPRLRRSRPHPRP